MSCSTATSCGDCLIDQWNLPTNAINLTSGEFCQWCPETNTCITLKNSPSDSGLVNFANQICPELTCALNRISTSPYICSKYGIVIFCLTVALILLTSFTVFSWFRSSKAKNLRCKINSGARGDYKRCRECGETSQNANFACKACNRHETYFGLTLTGAVSSVLGLWYTLVVPEFYAFVILLAGTGFTAFLYVLQMLRNCATSEEDKLLSSQYLIVNDDVEANDKFTFGLDSITTSQLRYSIAKEISRENQAVNFVLETTQHVDLVVSVSRFMLGFYLWISSGLLLLAILGGWNSMTQIILPVAVLLPTLGFATPMKNRKHAIVITSKNIIIAQQASRKVRISSVNLADVKEILIRKTEGIDQYGQVEIHKNDNTSQNVYQLAFITEFEAALVNAQFEGKFEENRFKLTQNRFTRNYVTILVWISSLCTFGLGIFMTVLAFRVEGYGFIWIQLWGALGMFGTSAGSFAMRNAFQIVNPFAHDVFVYTRRV